MDHLASEDYTFAVYLGRYIFSYTEIFVSKNAGQVRGQLKANLSAI